MDRALYERFRDHPVREILSKAAGGAHVYPDEIEDLNLPTKVDRALKQAIARVKPEDDGERAPAMGPGSPDHLASELVAALPPEHETRQQRNQRRAAAGDPDALAAIEAEERATERIVDKVWRQANGAAE